MPIGFHTNITLKYMCILANELRMNLMKHVLSHTGECFALT